MHFLSPILETYIANHSEDEPELLQELTRETHLKVIQPRMITGHFQGRVLSMLSKIINPKYILEIGTYTGYSALCLADPTLQALWKLGEWIWSTNQTTYRRCAGHCAQLAPNLRPCFH